jgi:3-oxoacyl-[acyl-carrier-protein] synthase-3
VQFRIPDVRLAGVATCDFSLLRPVGTEELLRAARPDDWEHCLRSPVMGALLQELGVERRYLTHRPGTRPEPGRLTALELAHSAVTRLRARHEEALSTLDALIFVSTSNPYPCNSQAALLAHAMGWSPSCYDIKAGCSSGVLGLLQGALLLNAGAARVLVVMAETLSQFAPPDDLRMLLTTGDGAACVLMERAPGPGFLSMTHGSDPGFARSMLIPEPFPPTHAEARYTYEFRDSVRAVDRLHARWRELSEESLRAAGVARESLAHAFLHQTHRRQVEGLTTSLGLTAEQVPEVVRRFGNMGTPTFAVALADRFDLLRPGDRYLIEAVGGGISWCSIVAEHG